jgi:hypothetical protein
MGPARTDIISNYDARHQLCESLVFVARARTNGATRSQIASAKARFA